MSVRGQVIAALEVARTEKMIGKPLDAQVQLEVVAGSQEAAALDSTHPTELQELLMVSQCNLKYVDSIEAGHDNICTDSVRVHVCAADGVKCQRCWHVVPAVNEEMVCGQCQ